MAPLSPTKAASPHNQLEKKARFMHDETKILCYDFSKQFCGRESFDPRNQLSANGLVRVGLLTPQSLNIPIINRGILRWWSSSEKIPALPVPKPKLACNPKLWSSSGPSQSCLFLFYGTWSTASVAVAAVEIAVGQRASVEGKEFSCTLRKKVRIRKIT